MDLIPEYEIIALDPGHSRATPGKRSGNFYEYLSNRNIAKILYKLLKECGFRPFYTVDLEAYDDKSLYNRAREAIKRNADAYVSIHSNGHNDPTARGTETYIHTDSKASEPFAKDIHRALVDSLDRYDRGVKRANFGVLRNSYRHMVSCLTEGEFFTTPKTREWMLTKDYEVKYALGVALGLCDYYNHPFIADHIVAQELGKKPVQASGYVNKSWYIKHGSTGDRVTTLQKNLNELGYEVAIDGSFGDETEYAVKQFQKDEKLDIDGSYGPHTQDAMEKAKKRAVDLGGDWEGTQLRIIYKGSEGIAARKTPNWDAKIYHHFKYNDRRDIIAKYSVDGHEMYAVKGNDGDEYFVTGFKDYVSVEDKEQYENELKHQEESEPAPEPSKETGEEVLFSDLPGGEYDKAIKYLYEQGILKGYGNGKFGSEDNLTRKDYALSLYRQLTKG